MLENNFSIGIDASKTEDGVILDFSYFDVNNNTIDLEVEADNYENALMELYKEVFAALDEIEKEKEEEEEELTEEERYIKELEAEIQKLRAEKENSNRKYNNKIYYKPLSRKDIFDLLWF